MNQVLEAQATEALGAGRHELTEERQGYRNGYRERMLYTRVGPVTLQVRRKTRSGRKRNTSIWRHSKIGRPPDPPPDKATLS